MFNHPRSLSIPQLRGVLIVGMVIILGGLLSAIPENFSLYRNYGHDLIFPILTIPVFEWIRQNRPTRIQLSLRNVLFYALFFSIWFEGIAPQIQSAYTADLVDIVVYGLGSLLIWVWARSDAKLPIYLDR